MYEDDLNLPKPNPKGEPFILQDGADKVLVEFDPVCVKVVATPDDDGVIRIMPGAR